MNQFRRAFRYFLEAMAVLALAAPAFGQFSITNASQLPGGVVGNVYNVTLVATGGTNPVSFALNPSGQAMPPGLSLNSFGVISGTPTSTTGSPFSFTVRATDSAVPSGSFIEKTFTLNVIPALSITDLTLPNGTVGVAYTKQMNVTGGIAPYVSWSAPALPSPLTINSSGLISGTPTSAGTFNNIIVTVGDSSTPQLTTSRTYSQTIGAGSAPNFTTSSPLPQATQTKLYSQTLAATGGTGALSYSLTPANTLPTGFTLSTAGVLSGISSVNGNFTFSLRVTDASSAFTDKSFSLTINPVPLVATGSLPKGSVGVAYSTTLQATGGTAPLSWTTTAGFLPNDLSLNPSTGAISGTATSVVTVPTLTFTVTDANGTTASATFSLTINPALSINNTSPLPSVTVNTAYSQAFTATGGASSSYVFSVAAGSTLPAGLNLTPQGSLSGTPTAAGTFSFTIQVTDNTNVSATRQFQLTVYGALTITTNSPFPAAAVNSGYSRTLAATGGSGTGYSWAVAAGSSLPTGLTITTAGLLSGSPTTAGTTSFTLQVTDSANTTVSKSFLLTINNALSITTNSPLPNGSINVAYSQTLQAVGGTGSYAYTLAAGSTLPSGLTLSTSGILSGTPVSFAALASFTIQLTDSAGNSITRSLQITIGVGITILTTSLPAGTLQQPYAPVTLAATGGNGLLSWTLAAGSALPSGVILSSAGLLSGLPTSAGTFVFSVRASDTQNNFAIYQYTLVITDPSGILQISTTSLPNAILNTTYSINLAASGGSGTGYVWSLAAGSNQLPPGLSISVSGQISGTPVSNSGSPYGFTVSVTDSAGATVQKTLSITVNGSNLTLTTTALPNATAGTFYNHAIAANGGSGSYTWSIESGQLPSGLSLSSNGILSGTTSQVGTFPLTIRVTDGN